MCFPQSSCYRSNIPINSTSLKWIQTSSSRRELIMKALLTPGCPTSSPKAALQQEAPLAEWLVRIVAGIKFNVMSVISNLVVLIIKICIILSYVFKHEPGIGVEDVGRTHCRGGQDKFFLIHTSPRLKA